MKKFTEFTQLDLWKDSPEIRDILIDNHRKMIGRTITSMGVRDGGDVWRISFDNGTYAEASSSLDLHAKDSPISRIAIVHVGPDIKQS